MRTLAYGKTLPKPPAAVPNRCLRRWCGVWIGKSGHVYGYTWNPWCWLRRSHRWGA